MTVNEVKNEIMKVMAECLFPGEKLEDTPIRPDALLIADLGLSSLQIMAMLGEMEDTFDLRLPVRQFAKAKTVNDLCEVIIKKL